MSALIFSDPHFHAFPAFARHDPILGYSSRVKEGVDTMDWLVRMAQEHQVDSVVCLGDVFHVPGFLDPIVAWEIQCRFEKFAQMGKQIVTVGGNHDVAGNKHSSISILPGTRVWSGPQTVRVEGLGEALCIPWQHDLASAINAVKLTDNLPDFMFGHFMCHDVEVATGHRVHGIDGVTKEWLDQFKLVLLGDAHKHQVIDNTVYLGSVLKNSFNDDGEAGLAFIAEPNGLDLKLTPLVNPHSPYFLRLSTTVRPIGELMDWIEETVAKADPNGARVYLDLQATPKEAAKVAKRFGKTTLHLRVRPLVDTESQKTKPGARIETTNGVLGPTGIIRQYVAAQGDETPVDPGDLVRKGEEYVS